MSTPTPDPSARQLPIEAVANGSSPEFDAQTLPDKLRHEHHIAAGNYGQLVVLAGSMEFVRITSAGEVGEALVAGQRLVIEPEAPHRVVLGPDARFRIDFYRVGAAGGEGQS